MKYMLLIYLDEKGAPNETERQKCYVDSAAYAEELHQKEAASSGYWPLYRYDPRSAGDGTPPFHLDSRKPTVPFKEYALEQARFAVLARSKPAEAAELFALAQKDIDERWRYYEQMAGVERAVPHRDGTNGVNTQAATEEVES